MANFIIIVVINFTTATKFAIANNYCCLNLHYFSLPYNFSQVDFISLKHSALNVHSVVILFNFSSFASVIAYYRYFIIFKRNRTSFAIN